VAPIERQILAGAAGAIAEMRVAPDHAAGEPLGVRVEQQLVRIEAMALLGGVWTVDAVAVKLSGRDIAEVAVPYVFGSFGQSDAFEFAPALLVEQAKLDLHRVGGEQREVNAAPIPRRPEPIGGSSRDA